MCKIIVRSIGILVCAGAFSCGAFAQSTQQAPPNSKTPPAPHDPHDLVGVWLAGGGGGGPQARTLAPAAVGTLWVRAPLPLTPEGVEAINSHKGGKGPRGVAPSK